MICDNCGADIGETGCIYESPWHHNWRLLCPGCVRELPMYEWSIVMEWWS